MSPLRCFRAAAVLASAERWIEGGAVLVDGARILGVGPEAELRDAPQARDARWSDLGDVLLTPGLVNAHAHLELGALLGRCPADEGMLPWIGAVLREKARLEPGELEQAVARGARRLLETGTTTVGDIDSSGTSAAVLAASGLGGRVYREVLDGRDARRTAAALERLDSNVVAGQAGRVLPGISPHAPHTVSDELLRAATARAAEEGSALSVHFAETAEELEWLERGSGPFATVLGASPRESGLALLERAGLGRVACSLVHANFMSAARLARVVALGAVLVHCPGTHEFFAREPVALAAWLAAGARVALGTDSLASNADLDLRREMALVSRAQPELAAEEVLRMATEGGAAALGLVGQVGRLAEGARADLVAFDAPCTSRRAALESLTHDLPEVRGVWIGGRAL